MRFLLNPPTRRQGMKGKGSVVDYQCISSKGYLLTLGGEHAPEFSDAGHFLA